MSKYQKYILLVILFISIGFAILTVNLNINGNVSFKEGNFDVHFDNAVITHNNSSDGKVTIDATNKTTISSSLTLEKPGDYIEYSFYVVNDGTMDASLDTFTVSGLTTEQQNFFIPKLTYAYDGTSVANNDYLRAGQSRKILFRVTYNFDVATLTTDTSLNIQVKMNYINPKKLLTTNTWNYETAPHEQTFYVLKTGKYKIEAWGSRGTNDPAGGHGGYGAYTSGEINLSAGDKYYIFVGNTNGYNGGGPGQQPGGGATDIRLVGGTWSDFDSLKSRIMVAAGGGGNDNADIGGAAGGLVGYNGSGQGGTQTSGGTGYSNGSFGHGGGRNVTSPSGNGAGGAGYYGGSSSSYSDSLGGAGGSSYISGHNGCIAIKDTSTEENIIASTDSIHYSKLYFTNTVMIDGEGYEWTDEKGQKVGMKNYKTSETIYGNNDDGFLRITYLGKIS